MYYSYFDSPVGKLLLGGNKLHLTLIGFDTGKMMQEPLHNWLLKPEYFSTCMQQLDEYFSGARKVFTIPYILGGTKFQQSVLTQVSKIPYGSTVSYSDIADAIDNPKAVRAVGMANATNKIPIIIPCHRVIGKNYALTGFGGGLDNKKSNRSSPGYLHGS